MPPESGRAREVADWFRKASHDLQAARQLLASPDPLTDVICFHAQQAAEKCLKAFLVFHAVLAVKTHDLSICIMRCSEIDTASSRFDDAADTLTPYAVASCYPDDFYEYSVEDAKEALTLAEEICSFVRNGIRPE
jgi:HEPN domain-containing protein